MPVVDEFVILDPNPEDPVGGLDDVARAANQQRTFFVNDGHQGFQPA